MEDDTGSINILVFAYLGDVGYRMLHYFKYRDGIVRVITLRPTSAVSGDIENVSMYNINKNNNNVQNLYRVL